MPAKSPNFVIVSDAEKELVIRDVGPWDRFPTITNGAEDVVAELAARLRGRRLFYYDSDGVMDEIVVQDGKFYGFAPGPRGE